MQDDTLTVNQLPHYDINDQVVFEDVNLIGTDQFTIIGRPKITRAKVKKKLNFFERFMPLLLNMPEPRR